MNVTPISVINATIHVDNSAETDTEVYIAADVVVSSGEVVAIQNGILRPTDGDTRCTFWGGRRDLHVDYNNHANRQSMTTDHQSILDFIDSLTGEVIAIPAAV